MSERLGKISASHASKNITTNHTAKKSTLNKTERTEQKNWWVWWNALELHSKTCFAFCPVDQLSEAYKPPNGLPHDVFLLVSLFDVSPVTKVFKVCSPRRFQKHNRNFPRSLVATLLQSIQRNKITLGFHYLEKPVKSERKSQSQARQWIGSSDLSENKINQHWIFPKFQ